MERDNDILNQLRRLAWLRYDLIPLPYWYGKEFRKNRAFLEKSQWWSPERIKGYQWGKLKSLLEHAYKNVPLYQERFNKLGLYPSDINDLEDFKRVPLLTKDDLKNNLEKLKARDFEKWRPIETKTGGTTGSPVRLYRSEKSEVLREAVIWRWYDWAGYSYGDKRIGDWNRLDPDRKERLWYENYKEKELTVNSWYLDETTFELFLDCLKWYKPKVIYSSSVTFLRMLAEYLCSHKTEDIRLEAVLTVGEVISKSDREFFETSFNCKLFDYYGMRENVVSANQCQEGSYHINSELVLIEFEKEGKSAKAGELANIIGTNLDNYAVPLIRYNTEDLGYWIEGECPCGRGLPLMKVVGGRSRDFLVTKNGLVAVSHQMPCIWGNMSEIGGIQFIQKQINAVLVKVIPRAGYSNEYETNLIKGLEELFRGELKIEIKHVKTIPRSPLGKYRFVISEIPVEV